MASGYKKAGGLALWVICAGLGLYGCGGTGKESANKGDGGTAPVEKTKASTSEAPLPEGFFLKEKPEGEKSVADLKAAAKEGDTVVMRARIAGRKEPFVEGMAVLSLADIELPACNEIPGDTCPYPWDLCCEPPKKLMAHTATIKIVDADGQPLKTSLEGKGGLHPLSVVVIKGTVGPRPNTEVLVVHAEGVFVEKEGMAR